MSESERRRARGSHDIGGFAGNPVDAVFHTDGPELNLRWLQFGLYAPIFRCHCRYCEQRIWTWGEGWFELMRRPMIARSNLVP
jgi:alpha-glucosidase (family GH31 glycosyl hydrolase)